MFAVKCQLERVVKKTVLVASAFLTIHSAMALDLTHSSSPSLDELVVTVNRQPQSLLETVSSVTSLSAQHIEHSAAQHVQQTLSRAVGVNMHRNDGQESLVSIRSAVLTGSGSCGSVMTLESGLPIRPVGFCNVNELLETHFEQADSIEVLRGPQGVSYGSKAMHGVINILSPNYTVQSLYAGRAELSISIGSNSFKRVQIKKVSERWSGAFTATDTSSFRDNAGHHQYKLSINNNYDLQSFKIISHLTVLTLKQQTAGFISGFESYKNSQLAKQNQNPEAYRNATALRLHFKLENPEQTWLIQPYVRYSDMDFLQHFLPGQPTEKNAHKSLGVRSNISRELNQQWQLTAGLDTELADVWLQQEQLNTTAGSVFLQETVPQGKHYDYQVDTAVISPYAKLDFRANDQWLWQIGLRAERVHYDYNNLLSVGRLREDGTACGFGGCRYSRPEDRSDSFSNLSAHVGFSFQLSEHTMFYGQIANGHRTPEITELYRLQRAQTVADLQSETLNSAELGWRMSQGDWRVSAALYSMRKQHQILRDSDFFTLSNGKTKHQGLELSAQWQFAPQWQLSSALNLAGNEYANNPNLSSEDIVGNQIDTAPKHFGSTQLLFEPTQDYSLELQWQHTGRYFTDIGNQHQYQGHDVLNLSVHWQIDSKWKLGTSLLNLTDERYADRADFSGFSGDRYIPGAPRAAMLTLTRQ